MEIADSDNICSFANSFWNNSLQKKKKKNPNAVCLELAVECLGAFYNHKKLQRYSLGRVYER